MHALPLILVLATVGGPTRAPAPRVQGPPADSLVVRLQRREATASRPREAGEAALRLGSLFYARGEYRAAADAFSRAAARLDPGRKSEALYWTGLSWLGLKSPDPARAALAEVATSGSPRRSEALLGIAAAWEQEGRPDQAYEALQQVLAGDPGEAGPAALERLATLADRMHRPAEATRARARLLTSYPASIEATMAATALAESEARGPAAGPVSIETGRFANAARARALAARAMHAGFADARVVKRGGSAARIYVVLLGSYPDAGEAARAKLRATRELGLSVRVTGGR